MTQNRAITKNVLNKYVTLNRQSGKLTVNGAQVIHSDVMGTNGVMHVIDQVLIPDDGESFLVVEIVAFDIIAQDDAHSLWVLHNFS